MEAWFGELGSTQAEKEYHEAASNRLQTLLVPTKESVQLKGVYKDMVSGKPVDLGALRGKTVILDFFTTWCGFCKQEVADINEFVRDCTDPNIVLVSVCSDPVAEGVPVDSAARFCTAQRMQYTVIYDSSAHPFTSQLNVPGWPNKVVITPDGTALQTRDIGKLISVTMLRDYLSHRR